MIFIQCNDDALGGQYDPSKIKQLHIQYTAENDQKIYVKINCIFMVVFFLPETKCYILAVLGKVTFIMSALQYFDKK